MKARDRQAIATLRSTLAAIDNAEAVDPAARGGPPPGEGVIAGAALGVGAAEVERRTLTAAETEAIVRREVAERRSAAHAYERAGQPSQAERLRAEADLLDTYSKRAPSPARVPSPTGAASWGGRRWQG